MREEFFDEIKQSKSFYIRTYRRSMTFMIVSLFFNILLMLAIFYTYFNQPERDFYATNGVSAPVKLNPMDKPNESGQALLEPDPLIVEEVKPIPF